MQTSRASNQYQAGERDQRPWGSWEVLSTGPQYAIKKIRVVPGAKLSLQSHEHRSEHWIVIDGSGLVTLDEETIRLGPDESVFIPKRAKHRIENTSDAPLIFIEIQTGDILDEQDITRFQDAYGRL